MRECPRCGNCYEDNLEVCPDDASQTRITLPGSPLLVSRYLIQKRVGNGAMGQVYLAVDQNLRTRKVAVKTVRPHLLSGEHMAEGEAVARFEREARTAASIRHPNVVDVTDFGQSSDGVLFLVMEYVEGDTLHHLLRREGTLSVPRTLAILHQVVAGVEAAHESGILHRDLKPANIFLMRTLKSVKGAHGDGFVKVGDFGLAKIIGDAVAESSAISGPASGGLIGTPDFMAPEQMDQHAKLDNRADIYSLGTIAYNMLGGRVPFTGDLPQMIMQKVTQDAPPIGNLRTDLSKRLESVIMRALSRDVNARPASATEWFDELSEAGAEEEEPEGESRVVVMAPTGAEVYIDDERHGSIGRSGRIILNSIPPGRHVLRVAHSNEGDDERVIEVTPDASEQIIQAQLLRSVPISGSGYGYGSLGPTSVSCSACGATYPVNTRFCGRCGSRSLRPVGVSGSQASPVPPVGQQSARPAAALRCLRCEHQNPPGTRFCGKCGAPITPATGFGSPHPVERVCPRCHAPNPANGRFCGRCGLSFA